MVDLGKPGDAEFSPTKPSATESPGALMGPTSDERMWAMLAHLMLAIGYVTVLPVIIGPLVIWLVKKDDSPFVDDQAKEALNFQISVLIVAFVSVITCIGPFIVAVGALIFSIKAAMEANKGVAYRYPYTFRFF